ncbi:peptidyl-prolyl cis-trans isomerase [Haloechinothrix salitolerans]|uniref:Peptidyl-prolyl cis-trans isomerase n=1 Tax=Haloechinothrix salitolerans TaxID=926830 RepID=A0ABW2BWY3_9PSEU
MTERDDNLDADVPDEPVRATEGDDTETADSTETGESTEVDEDVGTQATSEEDAAAEPRRRRVRMVLAVAIVVLLTAGGAVFAWQKSTEIPEGVAFQLAGRDVTVDDVELYSRTMSALYRVETPTEPGKRDAFRRDLAKAYAFSLVVQEEAYRKDIHISGKTARDVLSKYIRDQYGEGSGGRQRFLELLSAEGATERAVLDEVKRQLSLGRLFSEVTADVRVDESEVREAYEKRQDELSSPELRKLQNIVVANKRQARAVLAELRGGASFAEVAARASIDASTKDKGGALGQVSAAQLEEDYGKEAFAASKGELFGPVKTRHGWNVGRVAAIKKAETPEFTAIHDQLREALDLEKAVSTWRSWLIDRVLDAEIRYADAYRPSDPDSMPDVGKGMPSVGSSQGDVPSPGGGGG